MIKMVLTTLIEYKLNLNPQKADTDKDKILDGQEDHDTDGVTNASGRARFKTLRFRFRR